MLVLDLSSAMPKLIKELTDTRTIFSLLGNMERGNRYGILPDLMRIKMSNGLPIIFQSLQKLCLPKTVLAGTDSLLIQKET